jgi:hypothetical protein
MDSKNHFKHEKNCNYMFLYFFLHSEYIYFSEKSFTHTICGRIELHLNNFSSNAKVDSFVSRMLTVKIYLGSSYSMYNHFKNMDKILKLLIQYF